MDKAIPLEEDIIPVEPTVEEQIEMATRELEIKNNDLLYQIYNKEQEIEQLKKALDQQSKAFEHCIANLVFNIFGGQ